MTSPTYPTPPVPDARPAVEVWRDLMGAEGLLLRIVRAAEKSCDPFSAEVLTFVSESEAYRVLLDGKRERAVAIAGSLAAGSVTP